MPRDAAATAERERAYRQAVALEPRDPEMLDGLAWMVIQEGRNKGEALSLATRTLKLRPSVPAYLETYARALFAVESCQKALTAQARVIELDGQRSDAKEVLVRARQTLSEYHGRVRPPPGARRRPRGRSGGGGGNRPGDQPPGDQFPPSQTQ